MKLKYITLSLVLLGLSACNSKKEDQTAQEAKKETLFTLLSPEESGVTGLGPEDVGPGHPVNYPLPFPSRTAAACSRP